ncbi:MAG: hypothetical protein ABSG42_01215 [Nitrospirota bacterium]
MRILIFAFAGVLLAAGVVFAEDVQQFNYTLPTTGNAVLAPGEPATHDYRIGFRGPDTCMVETIAATSPDEALEYAKEVCPDCMVQDLTNERLHDMEGDIKDKTNVFATGVAPFDVISKADAYCRLYE